MGLPANMHILRSEEHQDLVILRIQIQLYCAAQFQHFYALLVPNSRLVTAHSVLIIFRSTCTGGAQHLVARAHTVCPSLATPLHQSNLTIVVQWLYAAPRFVEGWSKCSWFKVTVWPEK